MDDANPSDEIDGFESVEDIFDDRNENEEFIILVQNTISNQNTMSIEIRSYQSVTPSLATLENETVEQLIAGINQVSPINMNTAPILSNAPMVLPLNYGTQSYYQVPYNYPFQYYLQQSSQMCQQPQYYIQQPNHQPLYLQQQQPQSFPSIPLQLNQMQQQSSSRVQMQPSHHQQ